MKDICSGWRDLLVPYPSTDKEWSLKLYVEMGFESKITNSWFHCSFHHNTLRGYKKPTLILIFTFLTSYK